MRIILFIIDNSILKMFIEYIKHKFKKQYQTYKYPLIIVVYKINILHTSIYDNDKKNLLLSFYLTEFPIK